MNSCQPIPSPPRHRRTSPAQSPSPAPRAPRCLRAARGLRHRSSRDPRHGARRHVRRRRRCWPRRPAACRRYPGTDARRFIEPGDEFALIQEAWDKIHQNYVAADELDDRQLAYGAIDGLADAVGDTGHTEFMTPEERAARRAGLSGSYVGIGAEVDTTDDGLPVIVGVFRGSPAEKGGLHSGDVVLTVDDRPTAGESLETVISWIRGEDGTKVVVTVREGADGPVRTVELVRDDVHIEPVSWAMVPGTKTAVLRLEQFSSGAAEALHKALEEINTAGAERLVFDLRGNPGGYVNEAAAIASEFLASGDVYLERNSKGGEGPDGGPSRRHRDDDPAGRADRRRHRERGRDRLRRNPGRRSRRAHRRHHVRDRNRPRRIRARGRLGAPHRDGRVADAEGPRHLARGHLARRRRRATGRVDADPAGRHPVDDGGAGAAITDPQVARALTLVAEVAN